MCFNVPTSQSYSYYLYELLHACNGDRKIFANKHELKEEIGGLFVVIDLRLENVFGYTVDDVLQLYMNSGAGELSVRTREPSLEDIFLESSPDRQRQLKTRPDDFYVEVNICHSGPVDIPYRVMRAIFSKMVESGIESSLGVYDNSTRPLAGLTPTHYSFFLAAGLPYEFTTPCTKVFNNILTDAVVSSQLICNIR